MALNTALGWHGRESCRRVRQQPNFAGNDPPVEEGDSAEQVAERDQVDQLHAAIHQLSPTDTALVLLYLDDLSYRQMAEVPGNLRIRCRRETQPGEKGPERTDEGLKVNPDPLIKAWWNDSAATNPLLDPDQQLAEICRRHQSFAAMILIRDVRECVTAVVLIPVWIIFGIFTHQPWTWSLMIPSLLAVTVFLIMDRRRERRRAPEPEGPLRPYLAASLAAIDHQIVLLRNIFWWYLLPMGLPATIWLGHLASNLHFGGWETVGFMGIMLAIGGSVFGWIYWLNQQAVQCDLIPRRRKLDALLRNLRDESATGVG